MTPSDLHAHLKRLNLSQHALARLLGHQDRSARTVRRWASGLEEIPEGIAELIENEEPS